MDDIYYYFAVIYIGLTIAHLYAYFVSDNFASLFFSLIVSHFVVTHGYMGIFMDGTLLKYPVLYGVFPLCSIINLTWGTVWFLYKMKERRKSRYFIEFIPSLVMLLFSIPAILLPIDDKLALATKSLQNNNPLLMPTRIPVSILFLYMIHMILTIQGRISKKIDLRAVFHDFRESGYKFTPIITLYLGMILTLVFIAIHMMVIASGIYHTDIIYLYLPGAWILLLVFLQILDKYFPLVEFNKKYGKKSVGYTKSQLNNIDIVSLNNRLESLMQNKKLYRNENLTLRKLARHLDISPQQLSEYLNVTKRTGYREYISQYRIEEAKKILIEKPDMNASVVGFEVGFPSVSGFYKIFKKQIGISPADYRKSTDCR